MAQITVHAGDFQKAGMYALGSLHLSPRGASWGDRQEIIPAASIEEIDIATEDTVRKVGGGVVGWGAVGFAVLGPAGILAAILLGAGKRKEVTFVARLADGRKMLATTDGATYTKLAAAAFNRVNRAPQARTGLTSSGRTAPLGSEIFCPSCKAWSPGCTCESCGASKPRDAPARAV